MYTRVIIAEVLNFKVHDRLDNVGRHEKYLIVKTCEVLEGIEEKSGNSTEEI